MFENFVWSLVIERAKSESGFLPRSLPKTNVSHVHVVQKNIAPHFILGIILGEHFPSGSYPR